MAFALVVLLPLGACERGDRSAPNAAGASAEDGFRVSGSIPYRDDVSTGVLAVLQYRGTPIDTIDLHFGLQQLGSDTVVYRAVRRYHVEDDEAWAEPQGLTLYADGRREPLEPRLPGFSAFSAPTVLGRELFYWSLSPDSGGTRLSARRYDIGTGAGDSLFLTVAELPETDDVGLLAAPWRDDDDVVFALDSLRQWRWAYRRVLGVAK